MAKRLTASERRKQLISVGRSAFAKFGYDGTSVEEIARRAKVSKPIVYEHFGGKEGLYAVVVDREMSMVVEHITGAIQEGPPRERLEQAFIAFLTYVKDEPDGFAVLLRDSPSNGAFGMSGLLHDLADRVGAVFADKFKEAGYDPRAAPIYAHALVGMVTFVGEWWTEGRKPSVEVVAGHMSAMAWMGLRHLPAKPQPVEHKTR
jgi:AcrR family transcriptional regulator